MWFIMPVRRVYKPTRIVTAREAKLNTTNKKDMSFSSNQLKMEAVHVYIAQIKRSSKT